MSGRQPATKAISAGGLPEATRRKDRPQLSVHPSQAKGQRSLQPLFGASGNVYDSA
jgi:hypothetical protein